MDLKKIHYKKKPPIDSLNPIFYVLYLIQHNALN
jgi:hypothetical protein